MKPFQDSGDGKSLGWEAVTDRIGAFLNELTQNWSVCDNLLPRLEHMRLLQHPDRTSQSVLPVSGIHMALQAGNSESPISKVLCPGRLPPRCGEL